MIVEPQRVCFEEPFPLESGAVLPRFELVYEQYGELNAQRSNAVLVCHGLSGTAHAAGRHSSDDPRPGWWDGAIGPGKMFDTRRFAIFCVNVLGGSGGSTGPASTDPATGRPYGLDFPVITVADMVRAQARLFEHLQVPRLACVAGGCMGGFQALTWGRDLPARVERVIAMGATAATSAHSLAFFEVIRQTITRDPLWSGGHYYHGPFPKAGLTLGSLIGMLFWMTPEAMEAKFGRRRLPNGPRYSLEPEFEIQAFLAGIADGIERRFDPNSLLYTTRALDLFDLAEGYADLERALRSYRARTLLISYRSDWRYPPAKVEELAQALNRQAVPVEHHTFDSAFGHGAYLFDLSCVDPTVRAFLNPHEL